MPPQKKGLSTGAILAIVLIPLGVLGLVAVVCLGGLVSLGSRGPAVSDEVTLENCGTSAAGNPVAELRVENKGDRARTYFITVEFATGSQRWGTGHATVNDLRPGQVERPKALAFADVVSGFTCEVTDVSRV